MTLKIMHQVFLSLGSNKGNRKVNLDKALRLLETDSDHIRQVSSVYETEPWGGVPRRNFFNQAIELATRLDPGELLEKVQKIERSCGRKPSPNRYGPRPLDIDILFYDSLILSIENLSIPHPLIHMRLFVLRPLSEIAPDIRHPVLGKTVSALLAVCDDNLKAEKI
jgi:2-amino-4-hydroxy-6-hydroxymethyldihydropteridine diphosphokinase